MSDAPPVEARPPAPLWTILAVAAVVAAVFYAFHVEAEWWLDRNPKALGALRTRHFVPLIARSGSSIGLWSLPAIGVIGGFLLSARRLFLRTAVRPAWLLLASVALFFAIGTSVCMIDGYISTYDRSIQPAVLYPYTQPFTSYADVGRVETKGPANFLRNFPRRQLNDVMANHSRTHPPGPVLFLWVVSRLFGPGLPAACRKSQAGDQGKRNHATGDHRHLHSVRRDESRSATVKVTSTQRCNTVGERSTSSSGTLMKPRKSALSALSCT